MLPAIQSLGFCALNRKSLDDLPILQTPLAIAPDLTNYWEIGRIKKTLDKRISRIWKTDLDPVAGKLTYLVGIDRSRTAKVVSISCLSKYYGDEYFSDNDRDVAIALIE